MYTIRVVKHRVVIVSAETFADLLPPLQTPFHLTQLLLLHDPLRSGHRVYFETPFHLSEGHMSENCSVYYFYPFSDLIWCNILPLDSDGWYNNNMMPRGITIRNCRCGAAPPVARLCHSHSTCQHSHTYIAFAELGYSERRGHCVDSR